MAPPRVPPPERRIDLHLASVEEEDQPPRHGRAMLPSFARAFDPCGCGQVEENVCRRSKGDEGWTMRKTSDIKVAFDTIVSCGRVFPLKTLCVESGLWVPLYDEAPGWQHANSAVHVLTDLMLLQGSTCPAHFIEQFFFTTSSRFGARQCWHAALFRASVTLRQLTSAETVPASPRCWSCRLLGFNTFREEQGRKLVALARGPHVFEFFSFLYFSPQFCKNICPAEKFAKLYI
jgi:hypothetical protein